ncbi:MAG: membrane protein required for beta-lactamase induction [Phenylobacterium sp.]|jgi:membrane protein required for beta-lactamase induction
MTLITLLIVLTIERISATADIWQFPFYYQKLKDVAFKHMGNPGWLDNQVARWLLIVLPVIVVAFLSSAMDWLLLEFAFNVLVLLICIGCIKQRKLYKSFLNAAKRGDDTAADIYKAQLCGIIQATSEHQPSDGADVNGDANDEKTADNVEPNMSAEESVADAMPTPVNGQITDAVEEERQSDVKQEAEAEPELEPSTASTIPADCEGCGLGQSIVWLNFRYYCAILFWFVIGGPAGAVMYCMVREATDDQDQQLRQVLPQDQLKKILHLLDWLPARVCSAGYLLIGNFSRAAGVWVSYLLDFTSPAKALVSDIAQAAEVIDKDSEGKAGEATCMLKLAKRNVLFFLALVALLTLYGGVA